MTYPGEPQHVATPITGSAYATPVNNYGYSTGQNYQNPYQNPAYSNPYDQTGYTTQQPNYGTVPINGYNPNYNQQPATNYPNQNYATNNGTSNVTYNPQPVPPDSYNLYHIQYQQVTVDQFHLKKPNIHNIGHHQTHFRLQHILITPNLKLPATTVVGPSYFGSILSQ